jgi:hypothetical protein
MRTTDGRMSKRFYGRALAVTVAGLFAIALVAPASSAAAGFFKPSVHNVKCPTVPVNGAAVLCGDPVAWTNTSSEPVQINFMSLEGDAGVFLATFVGNNCGQSLFYDPGETCFLQIVFDPGGALVGPGRYSADLTVIDGVTLDGFPVHLTGRVI